MTKSPFKRKILKITAYILGSILVLLTAFHFWFVNHAEQLLEELVASRSNGKLKLHVKKFRFNWFSSNIQLRNAVLYSTDTGAATAYRFSVERINVRIKEVYPLVFEKKIVIDSLSLINPDILVTRLRFLKDTDTTTDKSASLPREMGKVYTSIQDALEVLKVNRFRIYNGKFTLVNKIQPDELPVTITHIQFHLDNLQVDTSGNKKILFSDNVALQTHHQDILFPDGRHRLSFSNFRINIQNKRVEFDSCTITASKGDSAKSSFRVFFDKLQLTNINFDTLYQKEIIKADSVYCTNPQFRLDVDLEKRTGEAKPPPKLNELIQQLTGDLELKFVVVQNGSFDINTVREGRPSSFTSNNNNFELQGLRIQKNAPQPLTVKSFAMAIRNYENFLQDSTYALQFDSILLNQKGIYLSNFSLKQMQGKHVVNSFSMPQFELKGLSWDALVFDRKLAAQRATLYSPVINYSVIQNNKKDNQQDIFKTLAGIGSIIQLNNLDIVNGKININFKGGARLQLENTNMSLLSQDLVVSNRISNLQRAVKYLRFSKGTLIAGNLTAQMQDVELTGNNGKISAGKLYITGKEKNWYVDAKKVAISSMQLDNRSHITEINGIQWKEAEVILSGMKGEKNVAPDFIIKNIQGNNTKLVTSTGGQTLSAFFEILSADEFVPLKNDKPRITNLRTSGNDFSLKGDKQQLTVDRFTIADHQQSSVTGFNFINNTPADSVSVTIPGFNFIPDLNAIMKGSIVTENISITRPVIRAKHVQSEITAADKEKKLPTVSIGKIIIRQPDILLDQPGNTGFSKIEWHSREGKNNLVELTNFKLGEHSAVSADNILLSLHNFSFTAGGKTFDAGDGEINTSIADFSLKPAESSEWDWQGMIQDLRAKDFHLDGIGKNKGKLEIASARLSKLAISSATVLSIRQLVKDNTGFRLDEITGKYEDAKNQFAWQDASYDKSSKLFSANFFSYRPALSQEEFMASQPYQADYTTLQTGLVTAGPFDIDRYLSDTIIDAGKISINGFVMKDFRDKRMPLESGIIKPLPVDMLKKIPFRFSSDLVLLNNANIEYSEVNEKNSQTGVIRINRLNASVSSINNYSYKPGDSLRINAHAYLMDSVHTKLQVNESYTDPLAGFLMTASMYPADPRILNPVLMPLTSIQVLSGYIDTLSMTVVGKEHTATGEMKMFYHDLKIKLLSNNPGSKKSSGRGFLSFLANTLIKNKNTSRTGAIFFERHRNRSVLNYLVKITLSGVGSSVGVKSNKKQVRRHKKELR